MPSQPLKPADRAFVLRQLPVFPAVALELIDLVDQGVADVAKLAHLLGRDPALSAEVLRQANSARFARRKGVGQIDEAITLLGTDQTCRVAMAASCRGLVGPALGRLELRGCWEHCVASAILAAALAPQFRLHPGSAYMAGLLHDIGCLALVAVYPDPYVETLRLRREEEMGWLESERRVFGVDHCSVGRWVADEWRLPDELCDAIVHHHDERAFDGPLVSLVASASILADLVQSKPMERLRWNDPTEFLATLPLDPQQASAAVEQATERIQAELG